MNTRRKLLIAVGASALAAPFASFTQQQGKVWRVGFITSRLMTASQDDLYGAFLQGMRELGYVEGRNVLIELRSSDGRSEGLPGLAAELVRLKVDAIVSGATQSTAAVQKATTSIPVVMVGVGDPISSGFVKSLARPGGNITGLSSLTPDLSHKHLEMLLSVRPKLTRVALLVDPDNAAHAAILKSVRAAALAVGVSILPVEARSGTEISQSVIKASRENAGAVIVNGGLFNQHLRQIAEITASHRLVSISAFRDFVVAGGLMSYGQNLADSYARAATYVDKILKGTKPADLPVEQPTKFELVVNMKTAKALGLSIPQSILVRADRVIE